MSQKIFISYRRDDSAAAALGIGQYLEHEFGRKNVFIDVDMRAGAKFPTILEERLAECKVMLVLIGPGWLDARDEQGQRRLDNADDWVRLEIAHALRRNITVIPVRINGTELPSKSALPDDIRGLLDHQAISVTMSGFRHDMSGLVRDIRSIRNPGRWRRSAAIAAGLLLFVLLGFVLTRVLMPSAQNAGIASQPRNTSQHELWVSRPGEWILYAVNNQAVPYYFQPSSVRTLGDAVVYTARFPLRTTLEPVDNTFPQAMYEDDTTVLDCKSLAFALTERTIYSKSGQILSNFKFGDPQVLVSKGASIEAGSILFAAKQLLCGNLKMPLLSKEQVTAMKWSYLSRSPNGDGDILYGSPKPISDSGDQFELLTILKFDRDRKFSDLFKESVIGLPPLYRSFAQALQVNCADRKLRAPKIDYFDSSGNWLYVVIPTVVESIAPTASSPFAQLVTAACGVGVLNVGGTYDGVNHTIYKHGSQGEQKISLIVEQSGNQVNVTFRTTLGDHGKGVGALTGSRVDSISLKSAEGVGCPGSYDASVEFSGETAKWYFKGTDCIGPMEGRGSATRTKS
jgi:hypothetical protein